MWLRTYFEMINSRHFQIYFEVSQHLGCTVSEVIRNKFQPDIRVLIMKYNYDLEIRIREAEKIKKEQKKYRG